MTAGSIPTADVDVTEGLVRHLLAAQHPDLANRTLTLVANGWDNVIFRLGDDLVVRMPRREVAAQLVLNEQRCLPGLAERLPITIPAPVRLGLPGDGYPWHWSVCKWVVGDVAADVALADPTLEARRLGEFLAALHVEARGAAPLNPVRGNPVTELRDRFVPRLEQLAELVDARRVRAMFDEFLDVPDWTGEPVWLHGDLHSANVIVTDGAISAVIDWGDVTAGDPACDLAIGWMLFGDDDRTMFRAAAGARAAIDDATWRRAEAWALHFAVMYLAHSADSERFERMGRSLLAAVLAAR